jgi:ribonuclease VapC
VILDSSALVAILFKEAEAPAFTAAIRDADAVAIGAPTLLEAAMVVEGRTSAGMADRLDRLVAEVATEIAPFTADHARIARDGWRRFGKGRHPAGLNLGDCFAYALAISRNEPLLFKGDDFSKTDVKPALSPHA